MRRATISIRPAPIPTDRIRRLQSPPSRAGQQPGNRTLSALLQWHRGKAGTVEHAHDELKNGPLRPATSRRYGGILAADPSFTHEALAACGLTDSARPQFAVTVERTATRRELTFGPAIAGALNGGLLRGDPPACSMALARCRRPPAGFGDDLELRAELDAKSNKDYFGRQLRHGPVRRVSSMVTAQPPFAGACLGCLPRSDCKGCNALRASYRRRPPARAAYPRA